MSLIFPKKEILYAPMLGSTGGGSARGWGRGKGRFDFSGMVFTFENPRTSQRWDGFTYNQFATRSQAQQPDQWKGIKTVTSMRDNGYIEFTAPMSGTYRLEVAGARGGGTDYNNNYNNSSSIEGGGHGRIVEVNGTLNEGQVYTLVIGARGGTYFGSQSGGGGGGSFFFEGDRSGNGTNLTVWVAAGGGGGGGYQSVSSVSSDLANMAGQTVGSTGQAGGYNGGNNGYGGTSGSGSEQGCSGSGVFGQGQGDVTCRSEAIVNSNGAGNGGPYNQNWGGFGGGAAGWGAAGGGGGYSGGGAKINSGAGSRSTAGGGGSYIKTNRVSLLDDAALNYSNSFNDNGYITMTFPS